MTNTVTKNELTAQVARHEADIDALDRAVVETGIVAARALERAERFEKAILATLEAAGLDDDTRQASYTDPVAARFQAAKRRSEARRQRIARSGLRVLPGGRP